MNKMFLKHKNILLEGLVFLLVLTGIFFFCGLNTTFFLDPQGIHFIRKTDSLSFASRYFNDGLDFFNPKLFNLDSTDGRGASEFPILYYLTAILYYVFGKKVVILKLIHFSILSLGVFCVYKLSRQILQDVYYAILITLFLFTSTIFNYYSFSYLPDSAALGFSLMGWYFFFKYQIETKKSKLIISFVLFTLGSLLKVTYFISPLAVMSFYFISLFIKKRTVENIKIVKGVFVYGIIAGAILLIWNVYVLMYNTQFNSTYFNTNIRPIWNFSMEDIGIVWDHVTNYWYASYFSHSSFHLLFILFIVSFIFFKKTDYKLSRITLFMFLGSCFYFILFYELFKDHDYYFLTVIPCVLFILINGIKTLQNLIDNSIFHRIVKVIFAIIVMMGINYSRKKLEQRYENGIDDSSRTAYLIKNNLFEIGQLGIKREAKVIIAPDLSQNGGLFFLDRRGWSIKRLEEITIDNVNLYAKKGAEYLLLATTDKNILSVGDETGDLILEGNGISIFKIETTNN